MTLPNGEVSLPQIFSKTYTFYLTNPKKNVGKSCEGKPHAGFDEGAEGKALYPTLPAKETMYPISASM